MYGVELHQRICCVIAWDDLVRWDPYVNNSGSSLKKDVIQANDLLTRSCLFQGAWRMEFMSLRLSEMMSAPLMLDRVSQQRAERIA